jgi:hypothetical protein
VKLVGLAREVAGHDVRGPGELLGEGSEAVLTAGDQDQIVAPRRELARELLSDPR